MRDHSTEPMPDPYAVEAGERRKLVERQCTALVLPRFEDDVYDHTALRRGTAGGSHSVKGPAIP